MTKCDFSLTASEVAYSWMKCELTDVRNSEMWNVNTVLLIYPAEFVHHSDNYWTNYRLTMSNHVSYQCLTQKDKLHVGPYIFCWTRCLYSTSLFNGVVCSGYFLGSCLAWKRCANLFAAIRSCAFLFVKHSSFVFYPMHWHFGNSSLLRNLTNCFERTQCTFLTWR